MNLTNNNNNAYRLHFIFYSLFNKIQNFIDLQITTTMEYNCLYFTFMKLGSINRIMVISERKKKYFFLLFKINLHDRSIILIISKKKKENLYRSYVIMEIKTCRFCILCIFNQNQRDTERVLNCFVRNLFSND